MDQRLVTWARAVKARRRHHAPTLWLFTDPDRLGDVLSIARLLPKGLCGIVFRHDGVTGRAQLANQLARICKARRNVLAVAGDWRLAVAVDAGVHIRLARGEQARKCHRIVTASAHTPQQAARARRAGATLVFISPVFRTASHPGSRPLGPAKYSMIARYSRLPALALGGIDGQTARRLNGTPCAGAGAIGALGADTQRRVQRVTPA
jgi:thiamine-phosphate pyrophosphorylase